MNQLLLARGLALRFGDFFLFASTFALVHALHPSGMGQTKLEQLAAISLAAYFVSFQITGVYHHLRVDNTLRWCNRVLQGWLAFTLMLLTYLFAFKSSSEFPRATIIPWLILAPFSFVMWRYIWRRWEKRQFKQGRLEQRVLIIGTIHDLPNLVQHLQATQSQHGDRIIGYLTISGNPLEQVELEHFGKLSDLSATIERATISHVIVTLPPKLLHLMQEIRQSLRARPIEITYAPNIAGLPFLGFRAENRSGWPFFNLTASPLNGGSLAWKWAEDKVIGLAALLVFGLPMIFIAIIIKLTSPGPVFFVQERHGIHGKPIRVYKFRSMRQPSDPSLARKATTGNEIDIKTGRFAQAQKNDPRITWIGKVTRKTSLDELPQLFNVLKGDMSLVGPRPHAIKHNLDFIDEVDDLMQRHYVKPGMTGLAQVNGSRGETPDPASMAKRISYDLQYIREWSLLLDLKIILMTPFVGFINREP
jgi:Undecaprenyl-phosphate glucose phosphotransferase